MNKELEALQNLRHVLRDDFGFPFNLTPEYGIILQALKRNEPMKVDLETKYALPYSGTYYDCPKCGKPLIKRHYNYCPDCGQKLDCGDNYE
ncbi:MAG: endonuclease Q family protein [Bacteroidia bacterium]|nr:endonuclease Q family protein [Bacteroidia bacterium]